MPTYTTKTRRRARNLYELGFTYKEVAAKPGMPSASCVHKWAKAGGWGRTLAESLEAYQRRERLAVWREIDAMIQAGATREEVKAKLGVGASTIQNATHKSLYQ